MKEVKDGDAKKEPKPKKDLVKVTKGGETIEVHPSVVKEHLSLGWKIAE